MYRTDNATSAPSMPTPAGPGVNPNSFFTLGNPAGGVAATIVDADWMNSVQEELCAIATAAGASLDKAERNQAATAIVALIAAETTRAEAAEALLAPKLNPAFSGNGTIVGSFSCGGTVQALVVQSLPTGYLNIGTGASLIGGSLGVGGALTAGSVTSAGTVSGGTLATTAGGKLQIGTGASTIGGTLTVAGELASSGEINNPWFSSSSSQFYIDQALAVEGAATFVAGATVYNTLALYSTTLGVEAVWNVQVPSGGSSAALESNLGLVGGATTYTVGIGYYLTTGGVGQESGGSGTFGLITGYYAQAQVYWASSDIRLKKDLDPITPEEGRRFVKSARPTAYSWKDSGHRGTGYVAQQLAAAGFPHLVQAMPHDDLAEEEHVFDGVRITSQKNVKLVAKYDDMIAYLHAALQDAYARIERLEAAMG